MQEEELQKGASVPFTGSGGVANEFINALLANERFNELIAKNVGGLAKADTISQATNLMWYDLKPIVQMLYPFRELIPRISRLPRVVADGGNAFHAKRIVAINPNNTSPGVSEGNRGARISITEQEFTLPYRTLGLESSVTFEARLAGRNLNPENLGISIQSALRSLMILEEQILINSDASVPLGTTPTPALVQGAIAGLTGTFTGQIWISCVALTGLGSAGYRPYLSASNTGGVPGQITKINADDSTDTFGGGSAAPSAFATITPTGTNVVTATTTLVTGALAYAWFVGSSNSAASMYLAGLTPSNQAIFTKVPASTNQPLSNLYVGGVAQDNSTNVLLPDGVLPQIFGAISAPSPGQAMATNSVLPSGISLSQGGSILYNMASGNTGLTLSGSTINEFDAVFRAAYDQYKLSFDRILISAADMLDTFGAMLNQASAANLYRIWFDADESTGRIIAGRKVTSYMNKFMNNTLDVEVHPALPPGTILFWSDRSPYELSGVPNILEAKVRQDYYQIQWPWKSRRYEYGVYVDEAFPMYFTPAFAVITNKNPSSGTFSF
jgi:hypothetical protein